MSTLTTLSSRRTALVLAVSAPLAVAACDRDLPPATPTPSSTSSSTPLSSTASSRDVDLVGSAREAALHLVSSAEAVTVEHPGLAAELAPWLALHVAHLSVLDGAEDRGIEAEDTQAEVPAPRAAAARRRFLDQEGALAGTLADSAGQADSGDLARALASMSAAVAQRLVG